MLGMRGQGTVPRLLDGIIILGFLFILLTIGEVQGGKLEWNCDPCIDRSKLEIHAIVHGTSGDVSWQQTEKAMKQAAADMGIQFTMKLNETFSSTQMAREIRRLIRYELDDSEHGHNHNVKQIDGLIVSIPDETVKAAVKEAIQSGIHVFGLDLGYQYARELGVLGYVAQDEYLAGQTAAREFERRRLNEYGPARKALFVNHDENDLSLAERYRGFNDTLFQEGIETEQVFVDPSDEYLMAVELHSIISTCYYDYVLLGGSETVEPVASFAHHECTLNAENETPLNNPENEAPMMVATFDGNEVVFDAIAAETLEFALTQENYLRGALPVIFSTIYASTGKHLSSPFDRPIYNSGPRIVDIDNVPTGKDLACQEEGFPLCNRSGNSGHTGECPCIDRRKHRIAGVVHGTKGDLFWETIIDAATQASIDMDVELEVELFEPQMNADALQREMASRIEDLCAGGVGGIFVSIPSEIVKEAATFCRKLKVPVVNINLGHRYARDLGIVHVGQLDTVAGVMSGQRMVMANVTEGYCVTPDSNDFAIAERCDGFDAALSKEGRSFGGVIKVPSNNETEYRRIVESVIGDSEGKWDGKGLLVLADLRPALQVQRRHQKLALGTFDVSENLYKPLDDGRLLFTIDQQPYLQGSMTVYLLAYAGLTQQILVNDAIETGPRVVQYSPHEDQLICEKTNYMVCPQIPEENYNFIPKVSLMVGKIALAVVSFVGLVGLLWMLVSASNRVVKTSQLTFLFTIITGAIVSMSSIIPQGQQTFYRYLQDPATGEVTDEINPDIAFVDTACMLSPWLYGVGFSIMFSALCTKIHRLKLIQAGGSHATQVEFSDVVLTLATNLILESTILVCWTLISPSQWERTSTVMEDGYPIQSVGQCTSEHHDTFLLAQLIFHTVCLFYAVLLSWQASETPSEFSENSYIFLSVLVMFPVVAVSIPISFLLEEKPDQYYIFWGVFLFLQSFPVICLMFVPKMVLIATGNDSCPFPDTARSLQNEIGGPNTNIHFQQYDSTSIPTGQSNYATDYSSSAPPNLSIDESLRANGGSSRLNSSSNHDYSPNVVPVAKMPAIESGSEDDSDSDDESESDVVLKATLDGARNHLKSGLDSDSSSISSTDDAPEETKSIAAPGELAGLASEISKAEQARQKLYSTEGRDDDIKAATQPKAPYAAAAKNTPNQLEPAAQPKEVFKRQSSPDVDDSESSSSDESEYVPKRPLVFSKMPKRNPSQDPGPATVRGDIEECKPRLAAINRMLQTDGQEHQINPQEGPLGSLEVSKDRKEGVLVESGHLDESGSSGLDANTTGITKDEASKAEIFRKTPLSEHINTPIRLKKQAQAYGENATLAMGITEISGSFLRKVALSLGSTSVESSPSTQNLASSGSKSSCLDTPARPKKTTKIDSLLDDNKADLRVSKGELGATKSKGEAVTDDDANFFL